MFLTDCGNSEEILFLYLIGHFILGNKVMFLTAAVFFIDCLRLFTFSSCTFLAL